MNYKHIQIGKFMIYIALILILYSGFIFSTTNYELNVLITLLVVIIIVISFSTLTVSIKEEFLQIKFGYGIFQKTFSLKEIKFVKIVKNPWYIGFGIKYWISKNIWIFNVSGYDAVEIELFNNKIYRIGTDEPKKLKTALLEKNKEIKK